MTLVIQNLWLIAFLFFGIVVGAAIVYGMGG
jgi:hypothetical protein